MSTLIHNERTKLLANALDRLSTASVAAGFIAPVSSLIGNNSPGITVAVAISTGAWLSASVILHLAARRALGGLMS
jgi:hypothetical protein